MDERKIGALLGYVQIAVQSVIGIIYVPLLLGRIGKAEYGLYQIVSSIIAYFTILETTLSATVLRHYTVYLAEGKQDKMENLLFMARKLFRILSVVLMLLTVPAIFALYSFYKSSFSANELREMILMFVIMMVNLVVSLNNYIYLACITAHQKYIFLKLLGIATLILQPFAVIALIYRFPYAKTVVLVQLIMAVIVSVIRYCYCKYKLQITVKKHSGLDQTLLKELWAFSAGILLTTVADQIFWKTDQVILGKMIGTSIVGVYSVGVQLFNIYMSLAAGIGGVILPTVILKVKNEGMDSASLFFRRIGRIQFFVMGLIVTGFISFGKEFVTIWVGKDYISAYAVALLLMIPYTIDIIQGAGLSILQAVNKYHFRAKCMFVISLINIVLTVVLINLFGMTGAAFATAISIIIGSGIIMNIFYSKNVGLDITEFWKQMSPIFVMEILMLGVGYLINLIKIGNGWICFIIHTVIYVLIYAIVGYTIFMNEFEKNQIKNVLKKIRKTA